MEIKIVTITTEKGTVTIIGDAVTVEEQKGTITDEELARLKAEREYGRGDAI